MTTILEMRFTKGSASSIGHLPAVLSIAETSAALLTGTSRTPLRTRKGTRQRGGVGEPRAMVAPRWYEGRFLAGARVVH
jgi:hypothetical protein